MHSSALAHPPPLPVSQRELLGLILGCAARDSATFNQAEFAVAAAGGGRDPRGLTRELLTDLAIRGWVEIRVRLAAGDETRVERRRWDFELASDRNWEPEARTCARYALTEKGRGRLLRTDGR